ncbi:MAG TPA: tRNA lysidine(34) synthetase TilS [Sedimentisphaerales bacterium]|nr:tRNA lysidine(34) synthetase TilS [Sedimentisphaerales bacterium]
MSSGFEGIVAAFIQSNGLPADSGGILLAVSGGADSMAMLHALCSLRAEGLINARLAVGHVNHHLRGQASDEDESFVLEEASRLGVEAVSAGVDVQGHAARRRLSIETAARDLRRQALSEMALRLGCKVIATAHHKDDNAETIMHRLLRGTGYRGLAGIWPKREFDSGLTYIRPLLAVSRRQILDYLSGRKLRWRQDASNEKAEHTRNFIRHSLLPYMLLDGSGVLVDELGLLAEASLRYYNRICQEADRACENLVMARGPDGMELDRSAFIACSSAVQVEIVQRCLAEAGRGERDMTAWHYRSLIEMAASSTGKRKLSLPGGITVKRHQNTISLFARPAVPQNETPRQAIQAPGVTEFGRWRITTRVFDATEGDLEGFKRSKTQMTEWFDYERICGELSVRGRREGDRFRPLGSCAEQKVGKFLTAARVPEGLRHRIIIVEDSDKVVWVAPVRVCDAVRLTAQTRSVLEAVLAPL